MSPSVRGLLLCPRRPLVGSITQASSRKRAAPVPARHALRSVRRRGGRARSAHVVLEDAGGEARRQALLLEVPEQRAAAFVPAIEPALTDPSCPSVPHSL